MKISRMRPALVALVTAAAVTACMDRQEAPPLAGPSTFARSVSLSASPDRIAHNGTAQSVVTLSMFDENSQPLAGQRVSLGASTGTLSHEDVVTGSDGRVAFTVTAPALSIPAEKITVFATPFNTNFDNAHTHALSIALTGTLNATAPTASFTVSPDAPKLGTAVAVDASGTTDEGEECGGRCSYNWNFGDGSSGSGIATTHLYATAGTFVITLTVVDNAGSVDTARRTVTVAP